MCSIGSYSNLSALYEAGYRAGSAAAKKYAQRNAQPKHAKVSAPRAPAVLLDNFFQARADLVKQGFVVSSVRDRPIDYAPKRQALKSPFPVARNETRLALDRPRTFQEPPSCPKSVPSS